MCSSDLAASKDTKNKAEALQKRLSMLNNLAEGRINYVGGLGAAAGEKPHLVHGVQELTVSGLEAVDLRNGTGDDNAHGVGHIVFVQRSGDGLIHHRAPQTHYIGVGRAVDGTVGGCFFCHRKQVPFLFTGMKSDDFIVKRDGVAFGA